MATEFLFFKELRISLRRSWEMYEGERNFSLKKNVVPVYKPKRGVSFAVVESIKKTLDSLENLGVISPTDSSE